MPVSLVNIFYNSLSFATATSAWTNSDLTSLAPDGWYSEVGIFRRQYLGVLGPVQTCPSCILSCGAAVSGVGAVGTYALDFSLGTDIGAVVVKFLPSNIPDKATWTYDGVSASEYSSQSEGYLQGVVGQITAGTACGITNALGSSGATFSGTSYIYDTALAGFIDTGVASNMGPYTNAAAGGVALTTSAPGECFMVIPKPLSSPGSMSMLIEGPCSGTGWNIEIFCPRQLQSFSVGNMGGSCGVTGTDMYYCSVDPTSDGTSAVIAVNDWVFTDPNGVNKFGAGEFPITMSAINYCITVGTDGVVTALTACSGSCV